jgi:hypothetical protein
MAPDGKSFIDVVKTVDPEPERKENYIPDSPHFEQVLEERRLDMHRMLDVIISSGKNSTIAAIENNLKEFRDKVVSESDNERRIEEFEELKATVRRLELKAGNDNH